MLKTAPGNLLTMYQLVALSAAFLALTAPASAAYFRMGAAAGHPEPLHATNNSVNNHRWNCFTVAEDYVQLLGSGPSDPECPFSVSTEVPWSVNPLVQQSASTRNINIWVQGYQGASSTDDWVCLQAYSYEADNDFFGASSAVCPATGTRFDSSLGNVSTPSNGTVKVMGFFVTPDTAYATPVAYWHSLAWAYDAT